VPKGSVAYKQSTVVPRLPERTIGPDQYDPSEDASKPGVKVLPIPKEVKKEPEPDMRRPLHPSTKLTQKKAPEVSIAPEPIYFKAPEIEAGPAEYEINYKQRDKRVLGDVEMHDDIVDDTSTQASDMRVPLYPDTELTKPGVPGFKYAEPTEHMPPHIPDKEIFTEKWHFYDFSKDNKFDKVPVIDFAEGVDYERYQVLEKDREIEARIRSKNRGEKPVPAVGTYSPEPVEERPPEWDFGKGWGRQEPPKDEDEVAEGDMLDLDSDVPPKVPVLVNMGKQIGRGFDIPEEEDMRISLDLEPDEDVIRRRLVNLVDMDRQQGREEDKREEDE
jgi:hypothetical protein